MGERIDLPEEGEHLHPYVSGKEFRGCRHQYSWKLRRKVMEFSLCSYYFLEKYQMSLFAKGVSVRYWTVLEAMKRAIKIC